MSREQVIEDVKRRLDEFKTAPPDEKPFTEYAHFTSLIRDIERLLDVLGIEAIVMAEVDTTIRITTALNTLMCDRERTK